MGPKLDIAVSNFAVNSAESLNSGFVVGDTLSIDATVRKLETLTTPMAVPLNSTTRMEPMKSQFLHML